LTAIAITVSLGVSTDQKKPEKTGPCRTSQAGRELKVTRAGVLLFPAKADDAWFKDLKAQLDEYKLIGSMHGVT
jgi:hypothetical protein